MGEYQTILCISVPLVAILLSFLTKKVPLSLGIAILWGIVILQIYKIDSVFSVIENLFKEVFFKLDNLKILLFTTFISLTVSLMVYHGNISLIAKYLARYSRNRKSAQLMTWFGGLLIFFDDYANTFIVGNTLKPITDRYKISREKLAYIVDSTAAPVASIALVSTWVGNEVKEIENAIGPNLVDAPYTYFLNSLKYSYYPVFTLAFVLITILTGREFGAMSKTKSVISTSFSHIRLNEVNKLMLLKALAPMVVLLITSLGTMIITGYCNLGYQTLNLRDIIASSDSINSLLIGSVLALLFAHLYPNQKQFTDDYFFVLKEGFLKISHPLLILLMAWSLGFIIQSLDTASVILKILPHDTTPFILPGVIFIFSALISFATGSSFSTMGIVYPMALPIVFEVCGNADFSDVLSNEILYHSIACVLAGAVFGDHCSPISDTTILSSIACECDHFQHVRTQMPYALSVGVVSLFISLTLANMQLPFVFVFGIGILVLYMIIRIFGRTYG